MGEMTAIASPSVRREDIETALTRTGTTWTRANHVTATASLSRALQETRRVALPIATLLDLLVLPARTPGLGQKVDEFRTRSCS